MYNLLDHKIAKPQFFVNIDKCSLKLELVRVVKDIVMSFLFSRFQSSPMYDSVAFYLPSLRKNLPKIPSDH